ncbi:MAG: discoidin domain-containing protein [Elusimicrobia bacterium]|nr:discoidin domain-containing protein [Elusimicrobiota bacterium]
MKKFKVSVVLALMLFGLFRAGYSAPYVATASTEESPELAAALTVDGNMDTRWSSEHEDGQWLEIDLGAEQEFNALQIVWENAYTKKYDIYVSRDRTDWTQVYSTENGSGGMETIQLGKQNARYLKIDCIERGTEWGNSIYEVMLVTPDSGKSEGSVKVTASSEESFRLAPKYAADGNMETRWGSEHKDDQWLQIDLGEKTEMSGVRIAWENAFAKKYEVAVSDDGEKWKTVYSEGNSDGGMDDITFDKTVNARFIKIHASKRATEYGVSIFEVMTKAPGEESSDSGIKAKASTEESFQLAARYAVDGNMETRWGSQHEDNQWLEIDLGEKKSLSGLIIYWEAGYAEEYNILVSNNAKKWDLVYSTKRGDGGTDEIKFEPTSTRYVKIHAKKRGTDWGNSIFEVEFVE